MMNNKNVAVKTYKVNYNDGTNEVTSFEGTSEEIQCKLECINNIKDFKLKKLEHHGDIFEIVDFIPYGYHIWNIGVNMLDGYLPLVLTGGYDGCQVIGTKKAVPLKDAQKVLRNTTSYGNSLPKLKKSLERETNKCVLERIKESISILSTIKGVENLK